MYLLNHSGDNNHFSMHLRGSCQVRELTVQSLQPRPNNAMDIDGDTTPPAPVVSLQSIPLVYQHNDPLTKVLRKPAQSYTPQEESTSKDTFQADSQWIRGASGMTLNLRAASIASLMGELRVSLTTTNNSKTQNVTREQAMDYWIQELTNTKPEGSVAQELTSKLYTRSTRARDARIQLVAQQLADASSLHNKQVLKVTIVFNVKLDSMPHLGGIHSIQGHSPHVYTTTGIVGDHEGPRCWIPCLDSASSMHRASHTLVIKATAPMRDGLSVVGCGEDFGVCKTLLHDLIVPSSAIPLLGASHVQMVNENVETSQGRNGGSDPHVIPPDPLSVDSVLATNVWTSQIWTLAPIRSLGFAVGPFKVLEDSEYFSEETNDDDDDEEEMKDEHETDQSAFVKAARENGEGIRQVYFAPLYERKYIHVSADMQLLHQTTFELPRLGEKFLQISRDLDQAVLISTVGVPLRSLSLVRDVLALPTYRTSSYTQIWIPDAVHGGSTSGALNCCPDVMVNPFVGGSIMDSRLLSPVGSRLPFYNGGRVLQMIQARCVIRGWITAALPLGESDDVGFGYIYTLIESFLMSLYERGHGAFGEGTYHSITF